ncbi:DUF3833 domain-containing protein [Azospirillum sp. ST 5-10]|uniref:DUF3833 domain-containing protein n=1 Tax=unclassified Azospirillum TaxID=2630922 RepID=UPI003F4A376D
MTTGIAATDAAGRPADFRPEDYFAGGTRAWGLFEDRFGTVRRQFTVDIRGVWDGRELVLEEDFLYADGGTQRRVWRIVRTGEGRYEGRADDVVGVATGRAAGNALRWRYAMDLAVGRSVWRVRFDDRMFLQPGGVLINRADVRRWGVRIGTVSLFFQRSAPRSAAG